MSYALSSKGGSRSASPRRAILAFDPARPEPFLGGLVAGKTGGSPVFPTGSLVTAIDPATGIEMPADEVEAAIIRAQRFLDEHPGAPDEPVKWGDFNPGLPRLVVAYP